MRTEQRHVLVTGGAGYLGCVLVPKLLGRGYRVTVLDAFHFGLEAIEQYRSHTRVSLVAGDIRDSPEVGRLLEAERFTDVIHLAAIANDPCADLDEQLATSVNGEAVQQLMRLAKRTGVRRFLYASSASVYGIKEMPDVTEDLPLEPITIYARLKAEGERVLNSLADDEFCGCSVRAATVCGYSPRLRLDLTVNLLTEQAVRRGEIRVFGGEQLRPNVHIQDLTDCYVHLLEVPEQAIQREAFNVCRENASVMSLAERIRDEVNPALPIRVVPTEDRRSYHLSSAKTSRVLGFTPRRSLSEAIRELRKAFGSGLVPDPDAAHYRNVRFMQQDPLAWNRVRAWGEL